MKKISVIGATGYAGAELLRLLFMHPEAEVAAMTSESHAGKRIDEVYPHLLGCYDDVLQTMEEAKPILQSSDAVFIALPHGHAMAVGKALQEAGSHAKIIDLGADYRFSDTAVYESWYKVAHTHKDAKRVYGLAEIYRDSIRTASIIGNAGCYTTASILALAPLAKYHLIDMGSVIIDAKSGVSGAGRSPKLGTHFPETYDNFKAYGLPTHRHTPEIEQALTELSGEACVLSFSPHLLPMSRGILATCYATLKDGVDEARVEEAYQSMYGGEYFIRLRGKSFPETKYVRGSNFCDIGWRPDARTKRIVVMSVIDNLVKGAAGQAIQNFNIVCGFDERTGLDCIPVYP
ncbi:N-acetyl-gamma-glutamyl-phosphate reductase [Selenomonas sp. TAMA-11512]|uniref:N-acetyl-gamma-glutamyl-phosphate reductase n=1 Tax=Selenomonas sp. TAMA-11512 TaxID=3095337 RepID=UPI00308AE137|nr:N-acetyl-gamma-glutamyl-phosphate reductase [Selenomonas sp. TAMA-11512]